MNEADRFDKLIEKLFGKLEELNSGHAAIREDLAAIKRDVGAATEKASTVHEVVLGNGKPENGLASRVPRLEESERKRSWLIAAMVVAILSAAAKAIADALTR